jgi:hypothetical protein
VKATQTSILLESRLQPCTQNQAMFGMPSIAMCQTWQKICSCDGQCTWGVVAACDCCMTDGVRHSCGCYGRERTASRAATMPGFCCCYCCCCLLTLRMSGTPHPCYTCTTAMSTPRCITAEHCSSHNMCYTGTGTVVSRQRHYLLPIQPPLLPPFSSESPATHQVSKILNCFDLP